MQKIVAADRAFIDRFGISVSVSGDYAIVGAYQEDNDAIGGDSMNDAGSVYLFKRNGCGNWNQVQKIVNSDRAAGDHFGRSVSISGNYAIVGAWLEDEDATGGNSKTATGSAYLFEKDGSGNWNQVQKIVAPVRVIGDHFGSSVSISGDYAIVGTPEDNWGNIDNAGSAYLFERDGSGNWNWVQKIVASDRKRHGAFGRSVSISDDYAMVGAVGAYMFERDEGGNWNQVQKIVAADGESFGRSVSISGDHVIVGGIESAYVFERDGSGNWNQVQKIVAADGANSDWFGSSVSISGDHAIVGALREDEDVTGGNTMFRAGSAYLFGRDLIGNWNQIKKIVAADRAVGDEFGRFVSISGNYAIVGAFEEDEDVTGVDSLRGAGSAYFFERLFPKSDTITAIACDSYVSPSGNYTWTSSGTYTDTCDSTIAVMLTINYSTSDTITAIACDRYISPSSNYTWTSSGTYEDIIPNTVGCDSIITVNLTINTVDTSITQSGITFTANASGAVYQWLDCNDSYTPIIGETNRSFTVTADGSYAVEVTENGCVYTSACFAVTGVGILENDFGAELSVYPNPSLGKYTIDLGRTYHHVRVTISSLTGQIISSKHYGNTQQLSIDIDEPAGFYLLEIHTAEGKAATLKVLKE